MKIYTILYLIIAFSFFGKSYIFYKTHNGILRKVFIAVSFVVGWGALVRAVSYIFPRLLCDESVIILVTIPLVLIGFPSFIYLWIKYVKKEIL
jgi:hypothetical protein